MLFGAGSLAVISKDLDPNSLRGQELVFPTCIASFELSVDTNLAEARCLIEGKRQITAARITEEVATLTLTFERAGWTELGFAYDELPQTSSGITLPQVKTAIVDSSNQIVDAEITVADDVTVLAYEASPTARFLLRVDNPAVPTAGEYRVDIGLLQLPVGSEGQVVSYVVNKTYTSIETIGEESTFDSFQRLIFTGLVYTTEDSVPLQIVVPELSRVSTPSFSINGDLTELVIEFRASVPAGERRPFKLYRLQGAV